MKNKRFLVVLLGRNGSGKGTVANLLKELGAHVDTMSDVLEDAKQKNPELKAQIEYYKNVLCQNVPCETVVDIFWRHINQRFRQIHSGLFVFDGAGRTPKQIKEKIARIKKKRPGTHVSVVFLDVTHDVAMARIANRSASTISEGGESRIDDAPEKAIGRSLAYSSVEPELIKSAREVADGTYILNYETLTLHEVCAVILQIMHSSCPYQELLQLVKTTHLMRTSG